MYSQKPLYALGGQKGNFDDRIKILGRALKPNLKTKGWIYVIQVGGDFAIINERLLGQFLRMQRDLDELPELAFEKLYFSAEDPGIDPKFDVPNYVRRIPNSRINELVGVAASEPSPNFKTKQWVYLIRHMGTLAVISESSLEDFLNGKKTLRKLAFEGLHFEQAYRPFFWKQRPTQEPAQLVQKPLFQVTK